jgi:hypothetical protein
MDRPHDVEPDYDAAPMPSEAELRAAMEESARDVAAGRTVPLADVLAELDEAADRIEARLRALRA